MLKSHIIHQLCNVLHEKLILPLLFVEGSVVDEEPLEIPRMDAKLAEDIVRKWQSIKSKALGPEHSAAALQEVRFKILIFFAS